MEVDRDGLVPGSKICQQFFEERERIDFSFTVTRLEIAVEKLSIESQASGLKIVSASLDDIGPPKTKVTWDFLANMAGL